MIFGSLGDRFGALEGLLGRLGSVLKQSWRQLTAPRGGTLIPGGA